MNETQARLILLLERLNDPRMLGWVEGKKIIYQMPDGADEEKKKLIIQMTEGLNNGSFVREVMQLQKFYNDLDYFRTADGTIADPVKQANYIIAKEMLRQRYGISATLFSKHLRSKSK
jgi:hypothetical protein